MKNEPQKLWNAKRFDQKGSRYHFAFAGEEVGSIRFGGPVQITLSDDFATCIDLWAPFQFTQYGQSQTLNRRAPTTLAPLLSCIGNTIIRATVADYNPLVLEFENGVVIEAPADQDGYEWEAWQIEDKHGFHVVCAIGGSLAVWMPSAEIARRRSAHDQG